MSGRRAEAGSRWLLAGSAVLAIGSIAASVHLWQQLRAERVQGADLRARVAEVRASRAVAPPGAVEMPGPAVAASATVVATEGAQAPAPAPVPAVARSFSVNERDLLRDPEYRRTATEEMRLQLRRNHPRLAEELGLSPEEADQMFEMLVRHQLQQREMPVPTLADPAAMEEFNRQSQQLIRRQEIEMTELLGPRQAQWETYQARRNARSQLGMFRDVLASRGLPLDQAQSQALVTAMASEHQRMDARRRELQDEVVASGNTPEWRRKMIDMQAESNTRLLELMRPHLSQKQHDQVRASLESQVTMLRATERLQGTQSAQGIVIGQGTAVAVPRN